MKNLLVFALFAALAGCSTSIRTTTETVVETKADTLHVPIDTIRIEQPLAPVDSAGYVEWSPADSVSGRGTLKSEGEFDGGYATIWVDLGTLSVKALIVPDTVEFVVKDTVTITNSTTVIQELSFWDKLLGYAKAVVVTLLVIGLGAFLFKLFGK